MKRLQVIIFTKYIILPRRTCVAHHALQCWCVSIWAGKVFTGVQWMPSIYHQSVWCVLVSNSSTSNLAFRIIMIWSILFSNLIHLALHPADYLMAVGQSLNWHREGLRCDFTLHCSWLLNWIPISYFPFDLWYFTSYRHRWFWWAQSHFWWKPNQNWGPYKTDIRMFQRQGLSTSQVLHRQDQVLC